MIVLCTPWCGIRYDHEYYAVSNYRGLIVDCLSVRIDSSAYHSNRIHRRDLLFTDPRERSVATIVSNVNLLQRFSNYHRGCYEHIDYSPCGHCFVITMLPRTNLPVIFNYIRVSSLEVTLDCLRSIKRARPTFYQLCCGAEDHWSLMYHRVNTRATAVNAVFRQYRALLVTTAIFFLYHASGGV